MFRGKRILGIIPARGGSKRLPEKNIRRLADLPLIGWAHAAGRDSRHLDRCILSTDCERIAAIGIGLGMDVPFLRPASLAGDFITNVDVALHAVAALGGGFDFVVLLQPTSPFRTSEDIDRCVELAVAARSRAAVSVRRNRASESPDSAQGTPIAGTATGSAFEVRPNGAVYVVGTDVLRDYRSFTVPETSVYEMPDERSLDIDTADDFARASTIAASISHRSAA